MPSLAAGPAFSMIQVAAPSSGWLPLKLGAGGFLTGMSIANDGTMVTRTNVMGCYIWNPSAAKPQGNAGGVGAWQQLVTQTSLPTISGQPASGSFTILAALKSKLPLSNSSIMYMMYAGFLFKSTDKEPIGLS